MGTRKRQRIEPTDDWQQRHVLTTSAEQHLDARIRPGQAPPDWLWRLTESKGHGWR
jgi:hypothetical protein